MGPLRLLLVEDNDVYRDTLELLLAGHEGIEVVGAVADGHAAVSAAERLRPDVVLMDFRLPGLDGAQATAAVRAARPDAAVVCLTAEATPADRVAMLAAGAADLVEKGQPIEELLQAIRSAPERGGGTTLRLTTENTAVVLDSTSDFPQAQERYANMRVVPLYVRFGEESFRDHVDIAPHDFYERLQAATVLPTTSQPTPQDFLAAYEELDAYERIYSLHLSARLSGTFQSASLAAAEVGGERVRVVDTETASLAVAQLALALQRRLARGTSAEELERLIERCRHESGVAFTVATLEYLQRGGRIGRAQALAGTLLHVRPILGVEGGVIVPRARVRGRRKAVEELGRVLAASTEDAPGLRIAIAHADAPEWVAVLTDLVGRLRPQAQIELVEMLGAVVGTHAGPGAVGFFWLHDEPSAPDVQ